MTDDAEPKAAAGWYLHPTMVDTRRYWDGQAWTDHIAPAMPAPAPVSLAVGPRPPAKPSTGKRLMVIAAGVLILAMAITMPMGYSGNSSPASIGNTVLLLALPLIFVLALVGLIMWLVQRSDRR